MMPRPSHHIVRSAASFLVALAAIASPPSAVAQVTVFEPPDLSNTTASPTPPIYMLGLSDNTITGSLSASMSGFTAIGDPVDAVSFTVPDGMAVTLVELTVSNFVNSSFNLGITPTVQFVSPSSYVQCATSGTTAAAIPTPTGTLGPGVYTIAVLSGLNGADHASGSTRSFNYVLRLHTQPMLAYNEGAGFAAADLGSTSPATSLGTLALGVNRIGGRIDATKAMGFAPTGDQADYFTFDVPGGGAGLVVTGITLRMTDLGSTVNCVAPRLTDESGAMFVSLVDGSTLHLPIVGGVLTPGTHELRVYSSALGACSPFATLASRFNYDITITTAADGPAGACCNRWTGDCIITYSAACAAMGMRFNGINTACTPATCAHCPADFNGVNGVSVQDIYDFLGQWNIGCQ